jgi:hypothetical protein
MLLKLASLLTLCLSISGLKLQKMTMSQGVSRKETIKSMRGILPVFISGLLSFASSSMAATVLNGEISVSPNDRVPDASTTALYITVREDAGVWQSAVRNFKPPPVLTKRIPVSASSFPYKFTIDSGFDSTLEGQQTYDKWSSGKGLLISVRIDEDGVAATRGPNDLVGKGTTERKKGETQWPSTNIEVTGRGIAGKILTSGKK